MPPTHHRIAMWSGPRNISTAMMRSFENRGDTFTCDEPLYAHYLKSTGLSHPGREEIIAHHESDWRKVTEWLTGETPGQRAIFYQKHMAHHLLPEIDRGWLDQLSHCFLIRDPEEMLTSLLQKTPDAGLADTGLPQQLQIFRELRERTGTAPPVIDSRDMLEHPELVCRKLCQALDLEFTEKMLSWPPGRRDTDGIWAKYWYHAVERSTGFQPYRQKPDKVPADKQDILAECQRYYVELYQARLTP